VKAWLATIGAVIGAILLGLAVAKASNKRAAADRKDQTATDLMNTGISKQIAKGKRLRESANKDKDAAIAADKLSEERLEQMAANNESLDAIADRFNSRRLRKRSARSAT